MFPNYAGKKDVDYELTRELKKAGIEVTPLPESMRESMGEVKTIIMGSLHKWCFKRAWHYWTCEGPGIPVDDAEELHSVHGRVVRVDGHCGCPSPRHQFHGLACGSYHVDSQEGLNALANTIKMLVGRSTLKTVKAEIIIHTSTMKIDEAVEEACKQPSLIDALDWIAIWESERVTKQAHNFLNTGVSTAGDGKGWNTCFKHCFEEVMYKWEKTHKPQ